LLSPKQHALPLTGLAAMYFWIPLLFKQFLLTKKKGFYSLQNLMFLLILAGLILPAAGTASFWKNFIETKRQSLKIEHASKIEQSLFTLDEQHQTIVREHKFKFRYFNSILDGKLENLQEFIDESLRLELDMLIDTLLLVDAEGKFYRPYTGSLSIIRGLVMYPRPYRRMIVDEFLDMGWLPPKQELEYVLNADGVNFDKHFGLSTRTSKTIIRSLGKIAATEILQNYNQTHGYTQTSEKANLSAMVMGSFVDNFDESPGAIVSQNLADFVELGFGIYKSRNYVDVIRDKDGKAKFVSIIYASSNLTTLSFLKRLFSDTEKWPENVKYVAISERPMWLSFPCPDAWKRMNNLFNWLKPPRIVFTDEVYINKELHLRCSYVAQNCLNYIISGYMPMKVIENEVKNFKARLMAGGIILLTTLIFVIYRLRTVVLKPAEELVKGVNAIANKNLDFKIKLHTKDEWEQLGNTFNDAIEGVKELQMANFIQNCILPDKPITSENSFFIGKTVPADEVGGDYYEAFLCRNGLTFIMGDVSGHSVSAALVVSMADAAFNGLIDQGVQLPAEILSEMNRLMLENLRRIKMMTCFCGHISDDGVLTYSNAGQSFPMLITYEKTISLKQVGYPLGAAKKKKFKQERIDLPEFCRILMYSDGVIEAQNEAGELFGYERLEKIVNETGLQANCESFLDYLYTELKNFTGNVPWGDDVTLVLIEHKRES
jgi:hypothetical protein